MVDDLDLSKLPIDIICPIMDTGKGVVLQMTTEHVSQIYLSYDKWREYIEHVNKRANEIKPLQVIEPRIAALEKPHGWIWNNLKGTTNEC